MAARVCVCGLCLRDRGPSAVFCVVKEERHKKRMTLVARSPSAIF